MEMVRFRLNLPAEKMLAYYQGAVQQVSVQVHDGRRLQFPVQWLRRFVTPVGITGQFEMRFGVDRKLIDLRRIAD